MIKSTIETELLDLEGDGCHLMAPFFVNGKKYDFIIDTGASKTVLDLNCFKDEVVNLKPIPEEDIRSAGVTEGQITSFLGKLDSFTLGDINIRNYDFMFINLDHINNLYMEITGKQIAGLLGSDMLSKYLATIDYMRNIITFHQNEIEIPQKNSTNTEP